jgi:DNA-binding PadR family transcriptional regulator
MARRQRELTAGEWAVLGVAAEGDTHGFAIARQLAPEGDIGRIWAMPRPLVYRAIDTLKGMGLVEAAGTVSSPRGPARMVIRASASGRERLVGWLDEPAPHVRDVRSLLLLKLLFLDRAGEDPHALIAAQRAALLPMQEALAQQAGEAAGFDRTLATWRAENVAATLRFLDRLEDGAAPPEKRPRGG